MNMIRRIFLDTNILLDFLDRERASHKDASRLLDGIVSLGIEAGISDDILTTVYYVGRKQVDRTKLLDFIDFLVENFRIFPFSETIVREAVRDARRDPTADFEDLLQIHCARSGGFPLLVTNDRDFPRIDGIEVMAVDEFLETIFEKKDL